MSDSTPTLPERDLSSEKNTLHVLYVLHGLAPFTFWTLAIVAMIIGAAKHGDVRGTYLDTHYGWLSRTFWYGILWAIIAWGVFWILGLLTVGIAMFGLWVLPAAVIMYLLWVPIAAVFIWYLYRVIFGWLKLNDGKAMG